MSNTPTVVITNTDERTFTITITLPSTCKHTNTKWIEGCGWDFEVCKDCGKTLD